MTTINTAAAAEMTWTADMFAIVFTVDLLDFAAAVSYDADDRAYMSQHMSAAGRRLVSSRVFDRNTEDGQFIATIMEEMENAVFAHNSNLALKDTTAGRKVLDLRAKAQRFLCPMLG